MGLPKCWRNCHSQNFHAPIRPKTAPDAPTMGTSDDESMANATAPPKAVDGI
jgi:hypothetical protein